MPVALPSPQFPIIRKSNQNIARQLLLACAALPLLWSGVAMAQAQPKTVEGRVDRLEQEMRAVQRKVFPNATGQILTPDIGPATPVPTTSAGSPATLPIADLTARVNAIESQLASLTGQAEENSHRLTKLEEAYAKLTAPPPVPAAVSNAPIAIVPVAANSGAPTRTPSANTPAKAQPAAGGPAVGARNEKVAAIERPSTGNAALDGYTYGFRLWGAKFYPEAQTQLQDTLDKYGKDPVASRTQNLLGRAYLDDGKPSMAAKVLFENYRLRPKGDRASESLVWVGEALIQLNRLKDACLAYDELAETFGTTMPGNVRDMMAKGRVRAKCGA
jgi:TolA-binding protein